MKHPFALTLVTLAFASFGMPTRSLDAQIPQGHFGRPRLALEHPEGYFDANPIVSADGLTLYFSHDDCTNNLVTECVNRPDAVGFQDIWMATRTNEYQVFSNVQNVTTINTGVRELLGGLSRDELSMYFQSDRGGNHDLFMATRDAVDAEFTNLLPLDELNTDTHEWAGNVTADGLTIVFTRQEHLDAQLELWIATRESVDEPFRTSQPVHNVNRYSMYAPWISGDGRFLLFADGWTQPRRPGEPENIFVSYRESLDAEFGTPMDIDEFWPGTNVNTSIIENTPSLSPDWPLAGSSIYYLSGSFASLANGLRILEAEWITAPGDFDATGELTVADIDLLSERVRAGTHRRGFDLNEDRLVDQADRQIWVHDLKGTYFGDANLDGEFNSSDLVVVFAAGEYEDDVAGNSRWATGDWSGDGDFTSIDLVTAFQDGGYAAGPRATLTAVPEPSGLFLLFIGLCGLLRGTRVW